MFPVSDRGQRAKTDYQVFLSVNDMLGEVPGWAGYHDVMSLDVMSLDVMSLDEMSLDVLLRQAIGRT